MPPALHRLETPRFALARSLCAFGGSALSILVTAFVVTGILAGSAYSGGSFDLSFLYLSYGYSPGTPYSRPLGIFYDKARGECYVADTGNHQIVVSDDSGMPIYRIVHYTGDRSDPRPGEPKSVVVDGKGRIFVTDATVAYLDVLDFRGNSIARIDPPGTGRFDCLALGPGDRVYATISGREKKVAVIGPALEIERIIELEKLEESKPLISSMDVDKEGRIYVTNSAAKVMIQIFDPQGRYLRGFGYHDTGMENFSFPAGIAVMDDGKIWVADALRQVVSCFDNQGNFITFIGGKGTQAGAFNYPSDVATDGAGKLFVLERIGSRYQVFGLIEADRSEPKVSSVANE